MPRIDRWKVLIVMLLAVTLLAACRQDYPVPTRTLKTLDGEEVTLDKWRGKGVILNFWASWCPPCIKEMPDLVAVHEAHEDIVVVGVNYLEDAETARAMVEELNIPFPIILDEKGQLFNELNVDALPTSFLINAEGKIISTRFGPLDEAALREIVTELQVPFLYGQFLAR